MWAFFLSFSLFSFLLLPSFLSASLPPFLSLNMKHMEVPSLGVAVGRPLPPYAIAAPDPSVIGGTYAPVCCSAGSLTH